MYESSYAYLPRFDGINYVIWSLRMEVYFSSLGYDVLMSIKNGYSVPTTPPTQPNTKIKYERNVEAKKVYLSGLSESVSLKVKKCKSIKDIWNRLKKIYGEESGIVGSNCERKKNKGAGKCANDKSSSISF